MLIKYFNHFPEEELRTEILRAINTISPSGQQVLELNQAVYVDAKQNDAVKQVAAEALVEAERYPTLKDTLPRASPGVQQAAFTKMLQSGSQEVLQLAEETLSPVRWAATCACYTLKAKNPQANYHPGDAPGQAGGKPCIPSSIPSPSSRAGCDSPRACSGSSSSCPYVDTETEALVGDFLKKIVVEVKSASPHLLSEFSVVASAHLDNVFAKVRKNYISLQGDHEQGGSPGDGPGDTAGEVRHPVASRRRHRVLQGRRPHRADSAAGPGALPAVRRPKEDLNRFEACIPLFAYTEKKDKLAGPVDSSRKVDLNRPFYLRRLNRLIRVAGALEIRTASKKIQEILDFSRGREDLLPRGDERRHPVPAPHPLDHRAVARVLQGARARTSGPERVHPRRPLHPGEDHAGRAHPDAPPAVAQPAVPRAGDRHPGEHGEPDQKEPKGLAGRRSSFRRSCTSST